MMIVHQMRMEVNIILMSKDFCYLLFVLQPLSFLVFSFLYRLFMQKTFILL